MGDGNFSVSIQGVRDLASDIWSIHNSFESLESAESAGVGTFGDDDVASAYRDFALNWRNDRAKLMHGLSSLAEYAFAAADAYQACELELSSAYQEGSAAVAGSGSGTDG